MNETSQEQRLGSFGEFRTMTDAASLQQFGVQLADAGFTCFRVFLDEFRNYLRSYSDDESEQAARLIFHAMGMLPEPKKLSPSWETIWQEFSGIVKHKNRLLQSIPQSKRLGEWQVLLDNPYTNQNIVVYPALTFIEAVYLYAYFRTGLSNNEYIRLQQIETVISDTGADET